MTRARWHVRKRRLFRPQRRAEARLKQWALEQRVPLDHAVVASELDWVYRTKIRKNFQQMRRRRSVAFFAGPYRSHRRLLRLSRGRKPSGPPLLHLSAARVRQLARKLRQNRDPALQPSAEALDPLLRGSFRDPRRHTYRGCHFRVLPTPFHLFGTAAFAAKRDFRWLAEKTDEKDFRLKKAAVVWRLTNPEKALQRQMQLLRWQRSRQNRRHFLRYFIKKDRRLRDLEEKDRIKRQEAETERLRLLKVEEQRQQRVAQGLPPLEEPPKRVYPPDYFTPAAVARRAARRRVLLLYKEAKEAHYRAYCIRTRGMNLLHSSSLPSVHR